MTVVKAGVYWAHLLDLHWLVVLEDTPAAKGMVPCVLVPVTAGGRPVPGHAVVNTLQRPRGLPQPALGVIMARARQAAS